LQDYSLVLTRIKYIKGMTLAEKYRPKSLSEVIGQGVVIKAITEVLKRKSVPKTWLFSGPSGCGKTSLAGILGNHFAGGRAGLANIVRVVAAVDSGVDEVRNIVIKANYKALGESDVKTIIYDEAHRLSSAGQDALLEATERPPEHVYFILCSTNPSKILDTIKTRCVKFVLKPVDEPEIFDLLAKVSEKEKLKVLPEVLEVIAENCNGSPREALSNLEKCAHVKTVSEARDLIRSAQQLKGPVDLARLLIGTRTPQWADVLKILISLENTDAESIRIIVANYIAGALMKAKSNAEAKRLLSILECFSTPYVVSDKLGPLLLSIGLSLGFDQ